jgi:anthranilate synthase component 1
MEAVKRIKSHIRAGDIFQCVMSEQFRFELEEDPFEVYRVLRMINPSPYLFFLDFGGEVLLGSSPEMLVRVMNGTVETCPIAGTRPRGKDEAHDKKYERELLSSVKEKAEHLMLVDLGRNDIGRVSRPGTVKVTDFMKVERYSHVMHIVSLVEGKLKRNLSAWEAFCACFPAGTLTGAPKIRAMQILSELEGPRRGTYGGAVLAHDFLGNINSCITIRSLWAKGKNAVIQSGAGVVADSSPTKEYDEVLNKAKAIRSAVAATKEGRLK